VAGRGIGLELYVAGADSDALPVGLKLCGEWRKTGCNGRSSVWVRSIYVSSGVLGGADLHGDDGEQYRG
jgi:hypothetical protein